ncbi:MAG: glycosyltransferase family A protein [Pseudomonadota bacterium]
MISVLMPAYNTARFIRCAIQSVLDQDIAMPMEIVVVDDGSTDDTADIVRQMAMDAPFLRLVQTENQGVSAARNRLLQELSPNSAFVMFADSDDAIPPRRLARDLALLSADPTLEFVYGRQAFVTSETQNMMPEFSEKTPTIRGINLNVATFRAQTVREHGPFDTSFTHGEDADYLLRLFERQPNFMFLDEPTLIYRQRAGSLCRDLEALKRGTSRAMLASVRRCRKNPKLKQAIGLFENDDTGEVMYQSQAQALMRKGLPEYTAIIPCHNAARFLPDAIASMRAQTHPPAQIIVVDDGSTDDTPAVVAALGGVELISQPQSGPGVATNAGIAAAQHDILAFLDADDLWTPEKMERQICLLCLEQSISLVFTRIDTFSTGDNTFEIDAQNAGFVRSSLCARKSAFDQVGPVTDYGTRAGEMVDWFTRAAEAGLIAKIIELPLTKRRLHADSMTAKKRGNIDADYLDVVKDAIRRKRAKRKALR